MMRKGRPDPAGRPPSDRDKKGLETCHDLPLSAGNMGRSWARVNRRSRSNVAQLFVTLAAKPQAQPIATPLGGDSFFAGSVPQA